MGSERESAYYLEAPDALGHGVHKPFADADASRLLLEIGAVIGLLPDPPARVLDMGVGTGWTSAFLARRGFAVLGTELSAEAVAAGAAAFGGTGELELRVHDFDSPLPERGVFDAALWFDALHHAQDETLALRNTLAALKPGGVCVVCEPGAGHGSSPGSLEAVRLYGVRERDMPPSLVVAAAAAAGFASWRVLPHPHELHRTLYAPYAAGGLRGRLLGSRAGTLARRTRAVTATSGWGLVVLTAPA